METVVEIEGVNGDLVVIAGEYAGVEGIWLMSEVEGMYDPEIQAQTRTVANRPGTSFVSHRILERTLIFKVQIEHGEGPGNTWRERDARWRRLWAYDRYTSVRVVTDEGSRVLKARLSEIEVDTTFDPHVNPATEVVMTVVADDPFWYAPDDIFDVTVSKTANLTVLEANPTDNLIFPVWVLEAPATWTVPDWSPEEPTKKITLPALLAGGHTVVDTDPGARQLSSVLQDPIWARMNGVRFRNGIPAYTNKLTFTLSHDSSTPKQAQLRLKRPFSRPWGA